MSADRFSKIGLARKLKLPWLEKTTSLLRAGYAPAKNRVMLRDQLQGAFPDSNPELRGSLNKTISILSTTWLEPPALLLPLRDEALQLLASETESRQPGIPNLALHWGMLMAVYPFWAAVATQTGRLLRLQDSIQSSQVQRRIREQFGERETVSAGTSRVLRSFKDWGLLPSNSLRGLYSASITWEIKDPKLISWLIEALLHSQPRSLAPLKELLDSPALFPFKIMSWENARLLESAPRLELFRQSLNEQLVMLRR